MQVPVTSREVAQLLGISPARLRNLVLAGFVPDIKKNGHGQYVWLPDDVAAARKANDATPYRAARKAVARAK